VIRLLPQISVPQLRASWGRTSLVVGGTLTGVALIVGINIINTSVLANVRRTIALLAGPADLEVTLGVGEIGFPETAVERARAVPGVRTAIPLVRGTVALADDPRETLQLFGADLAAEEDLARYPLTAVTSRRELVRTLEDARSVLLTEAFASRQGVRVGEGIRLSTPMGVAELVVRGLMRAEGFGAAFGGQLAVMDLPAAQWWLRKERRVDQIDVVLHPGSELDEVARRLREALPAQLTVARPVHRALQYERILASFQAMLAGLSMLCLVAGLFIIYNTTSTGAVHRALVMAGLRRIGATPAQVFRLLMLEALVLGAVGTLLGIAAGVVLARLLVGMVTESMGVIFQLRLVADGQTVEPRQLAVIALVGIAATLFASAFAARLVARMDPLDAMHAAALRPFAARPPRALVAWWLVLVVVSAAALVCQQQLKSSAWGNFGATLWNASVIVIAIPLVGWIGGALSRLLSRLFRAEGEVAAASLFRSPTRTGVTVAAVALVLTVGITVASLASSFHRSTATYVQGFLAGDLVVSAVATEGGWLETPLPETLAHELATLPGVRAVESVRALPGQMFRGERIGVGAVTDAFFDPARLPAGWYREGDPVRAAAALRAGEAANVSTGLADRFDLHVGDSIELETPTGKLVLPVVGVVPDLISDRGSVLISRRLLVERWHEPTVSRINLFLEPGESLDTVRARIVERFGGRHRLKVLSMRDVLAYHEDKVNRAFAFTDAIQLLIIVVTVAGILDLLLSAIIERRRELAVWRLIGADERAVRRSVVIESATVGAIGAVLGVLVGAVTAWIWIAVNFRYLLGYHLEHHLALGATAWYVALVMLMTVLAGSAAARRATRMPILDGIRTE
jgi:putative ABC transport system permease protein